MAITVNLYTFAKKVNSTGRPASSPVAVDCVLKDSCSVIYPVIGIDRGIAWNPAAFNYAYISAFNRYYYINDWSFAEGLWWAALGVDALATWRTNIYNATEYVLRSSASYDGNIIDTMFPAKTTYRETSYVWPTGNNPGPWITNLSGGIGGGFYVIGIVNSDISSRGAVSYYAFTPDQFATFKHFLMGDISWTDITTTNPDIGENLYKSLFNPFQYIVSAKWFPFEIPTGVSGIGEAITELTFGWWSFTGFSCYRVRNFRHLISDTLRAYRHPLSTTRGNYLNLSPYNVYRLYAPPFGEFDLDSTLFGNAPFTNGYENVFINIRVDILSGSASLAVSVGSQYHETGVILLQIETPLAIDVQIAQLYSENSLSNFASSLDKSLQGLFKQITQGSPEHGISASFGIADAANIGELHIAQQGLNGSLSQFDLPFMLVTISQNMTDDANTDKGRPLCREAQLSTLAPGYVVTAGSHIALAGTETEISMVNDSLDGGVFLE